MSQVTEQSVRFQTALASIKLIQASAVLDLTEDDFDFLTSNKVWIATDRSRARRYRASRELDFGIGDTLALEGDIGKLARGENNHGVSGSGIFKDIENNKSLPPSWARASEIEAASGRRNAA